MAVVAVAAGLVPPRRTQRRGDLLAVRSRKCSPSAGATNDIHGGEFGRSRWWFGACSTAKATYRAGGYQGRSPSNTKPGFRGYKVAR